MRSGEYKLYHNGYGDEMKGRFQSSINIKPNITKMFVCQMINYLRFQIFKSYFVAITGKINQRKEKMW